MIVVLPILSPDTIPVAVSTAATAGLLLLHMPPLSSLASANALPTHTMLPPVIADGEGRMVTVVVV